MATVYSPAPMNDGKAERAQFPSILGRPNPKSQASGPRMSLSEGELLLLWERVLPLSMVSVLPLDPDSDFFMHGGNSILLMNLQGAIKQGMGVTLATNKLYQASTIRQMASLIAAQANEQLPELNQIDWRPKLSFRKSWSRKRREGVAHEVLLLRAFGFLGSAILQALERDPSVKTIHCIAVRIRHMERHSQTRKVVCYAGNLVESSLGLAEGESERLRSSSTQFLTEPALSRAIPVFRLLEPFESVVRPHCNSGHLCIGSSTPDGRVRRLHRYELGQRVFPRESVSPDGPAGLCVHRPCALKGDRAASVDALNAVVRYSLLARLVPLFDNSEGFLGFRDVHEPSDRAAEEDVQTISFVHQSSGVKVPVYQFRQHLERLYGEEFQDVSVLEWIERARAAGHLPLITTYLKAMVDKGATIQFP
ncbi:uncharacterized protein Aud_010206 [Aspergillus udagawae]|uniref:Carrier domain-containing protein n=1 Tax=Aspergillus udagawae TaxID=91492 RepID=A0A8E0V3K9_9EURO|nr:uncharacterized protein Aud_010206 [Aspergillus udagawae]GIC93718.1 hypothetical protein Aud_010206 [Aspergillus udagawae]